MTSDIMFFALIGVIVIVAAVIVYSLYAGHESAYWKDQDD